MEIGPLAMTPAMAIDPSSIHLSFFIVVLIGIFSALQSKTPELFLARAVYLILA